MLKHKYMQKIKKAHYLRKPVLFRVAYNVVAASGLEPLTPGL